MSMSGKHGTERCLRCGGCLWLPMAKLPATYGKASCCSFLLPAAASCVAVAACGELGKPRWNLLQLPTLRWMNAVDEHI